MVDFSYWIRVERFNTVEKLGCTGEDKQPLQLSSSADRDLGRLWIMGFSLYISQV